MGNITRIGKREKGYFDRNEKDWWDIIRCLVVVDECHNILNIEKAYAAKWFVTLMSEARKYFTGIALATQRVQRMFPNADNAQDKDTVEAANKLKRNIWFDSIQNSLKTRFYFNWLLKKSLGIHLQKQNTTLFLPLKQAKEVGGSQGILSISGDQNIQMTFQVTEEELALFNGGA